MNTIEIQKHLNKIHCSLKNNVYAANRLPLYVKTPMYLISNLDPDSEPGSHWVGMYIDRNGIGGYFDSYGRPPTGHHKAFFRRNARHWDFNRYRIQLDWSSVCGEYSLTYLHYMYYGNTLRDYLSMFCEDKFINDIVVSQLFKRLF